MPSLVSLEAPKWGRLSISTNCFPNCVGALLRTDTQHLNVWLLSTQTWLEIATYVLHLHFALLR